MKQQDIAHKKQNVQQSKIQHYTKLIMAHQKFNYPYLQKQLIIGNHRLLSCYGNDAIFAKLKVNSPGDVYEREANRSERMVIGALQSKQRNQIKSRKELTQPRQLPSKTPEFNEDLNSQIRMLRGRGHPLSESLLNFFESQFGCDFSQVRIHYNHSSHQLAQSLNARALTIGDDIIFGSGEYTPNSLEGKRLLAHELTHVIHSRYASQRNYFIYRDADILELTSSPTLSFVELWRQFNSRRIAAQRHLLHSETVEAEQTTNEALSLVPDILRTMSTDDAIEYAGDLAFWLMDQGRQDLAQRALQRLEMAWWFRYLPNAVRGLTSTGHCIPTRPRQLIDRAISEAGANHHSQAITLFKLAFLFLQMELNQFYLARTEFLERQRSFLQETDFGASLQEQAQEAVARREVETRIFSSRIINSYPYLRQRFEMMREILGFYPSLEREALFAGDQELASSYSNLSFILRIELSEGYTLGLGQTTVEADEPEALTEARRTTAEFSAAITMESTQTRTSGGGVGYIIHGAEGLQEIVEPLPGVPGPERMGQYPVYWSSFENLLTSIAGQEEFITSLYRYAEIRREFPRRPPDMHNQRERFRVWSIMYSVFQSRDELGFGALASLLRLMEEYLTHFTIHTRYNIRDFGENYLTSEFPQDLIGRVVHDCGVYALTIAYEVYLTARNASPRLPVSFRLYFMPGHAVLVILDQSQDNFYITNNNRIQGPMQGDPLEWVASSYGEIYGLRHVLAPAVSVDIGSTALSPSTFRSQAWQRYISGSSWTLIPEPYERFQTRSEEEQASAVRTHYRQFYDSIVIFDRESGRLQTAINNLSQEIASLDRPSDIRHLLEERLPELIESGNNLWTIFEEFGRQAHISVSRQAPQGTIGLIQRLFLHTTGLQSSNYVLARLGMVLLYAQSQGLELTPSQQELINDLNEVIDFREQIQQYISQGLPATF